jgi:hypothetical protein
MMTLIRSSNSLDARARQAALGLAALIGIACSGTPAEARRIAIDNVTTLTTPGCSFFDTSCSPYTLPFQLNVGGALTSEIYLYEDFDGAALSIGSRFSPGSSNLIELNVFGDLSGEAIFSLRDPGVYALMTYSPNDGGRFTDDFALFSFAPSNAPGTVGGFALTIDCLSGSCFDQSYSVRIADQSLDCFDSECLPSSGGNASTLTLTFPGLASAVPEPATWAMMLLGFGFVGAALRRQGRQVSGTPTQA